MIRFTKHGILIDRLFLFGLLNVCFDVPRQPKAVICVDSTDCDHPKIYSALPRSA